MSTTKNKRQPSAVETADDQYRSDQKMVICHLRELHKFVEYIMAYAEEPANWPLSQQEQIAFVRTVVFQACRLRKSKGYVKAAAAIAAEDLAMAA